MRIYVIGLRLVVISGFHFINVTPSSPKMTRITTIAVVATIFLFVAFALRGVHFGSVHTRTMFLSQTFFPTVFCSDKHFTPIFRHPSRSSFNITRLEHSFHYLPVHDNIVYDDEEFIVDLELPQQLPSCLCYQQLFVLMYLIACILFYATYVEDDDWVDVMLHSICDERDYIKICDPYVLNVDSEDPRVAGLYSLLGLKASVEAAMVEDLCVFLTDLFSSTSVQGYVKACLVFARTRHIRDPNTSHLTWLTNYLAQDSTKESVRSILETRDPYEVNSFIGDLGEGIERVSNLFRGERGNKFMSFFVMVFSAATFLKFGTTDTKRFTYLQELWSVKEKFSDNMDVLALTLESVRWVCTSGWQAFSTMSLDPFLHSESSWAKWDSESKSAIAKRDHIGHLELYESGDGLRTPTITEYRDQLINLLERGSSISKRLLTLQKIKGKTVADQRILELKTCLAEATSALVANNPRAAPLSVLIYGGTGIRKTYIVDCLMAIVFQQEGKKMQSTNIYSRSYLDDYWSGYAGDEKVCVIMDDIGSVKPTVVKGIPPDMCDLLQITNNVPYSTNQADLPDKGLTFFNSKAVFATTNRFDLNLSDYFNYPLAVMRRFPFTIVATAKRACSTTSSVLLAEHDPTRWVLRNDLVPDVSGINDYWDFVVKTPTGVAGNGSISYTVVLDTRSDVTTRAIDQLTRFYGEYYSAHKSNQQAYLGSRLKIESEVKFCGACNVVEQYCKCEHDVQDKVYYLGVLLVFPCLYLWPWFVGFVQRYIARVAPGFFYRLGVITLGDALRLYAPRLDNGKPAMLKLMAAGLVLSTLYWLLRPKKHEANSHDDLVSGLPSNPWINSDVSPLSQTSSTTSGPEGLERLISRISKNVVHVGVMIEEGGVSKTMGIGLLGDVILINAHPLKKLDKDKPFVVKVWRPAKFIPNVSTCTIEWSHVCVDLSSDLAVIKLGAMQFADIVGIERKCGVFSVTAPKVSRGVYVKNNKPTPLTTIQLDTNPVVTAIPTLKLAYQLMSPGFVKGDCGTPLLLECVGGSYCLGGIHMASNTSGSCLSAVVTHTLITDMIGELSLPAIYDVADPFLAQDHYIGPLHDKCVVGDRWLPIHTDKGLDLSGPYDIIGGLTSSMGRPFRMGATDKVVDCLTKSMVEDFGYVNESVLPVMSGYEPEASFLDRCRSTFGCNTLLLNMCAISFKEKIYENVPKKKYCSTISDYDNVNGIPTTRVEGINLSKSAGYPFNNAKRNLCYQVEPREGHTSAFMPDAVIMDDVERIESCYEAGKLSGSVWTAFWKAEFVSVSKRAACKTRAIFCSTFAFLFVMRRYFATLYALVMVNNFVFETAWSVNAVGPDWGKIADTLMTFGVGRVLAGDYVNFDVKAWFPDLSRVVFDTMVDISIHYGDFSDRDIQVMRGAAYEVQNPMVNFFGVLMLFFGINPSGQSGTTCGNSFANSILLRYVYVLCRIHACGSPHTEQVYKFYLSEFNRKVKLVTYGDDHIAAVHPSITCFNCNSVARFFQTLNIGYTDSVKSDVLPTTLSLLENETFLKRSFLRYKGHYLAPLKIESIFRSGLQAISPKAAPMTLACDFVRSVHGAIVQHGPAFFMKHLPLIDAICLSLGIPNAFERDFDECIRVLYDEPVL